MQELGTKQISDTESLVIQYLGALAESRNTPREHVELELRKSKLNKPVWTSLYKNLAETVENNIINWTVSNRKIPGVPMNRCVKTYNPITGNITETCETKIELGRVNFIDFKLSLSREITDPGANPKTFVPPGNRVAWYRFRSIVRNSRFPNWQFHFAYIFDLLNTNDAKSRIDIMNTHLKKYIDDYMAGIHALGTVGFVGRCDFEIEYVPGDKTREPRDITNDIIAIINLTKATITGGDEAANSSEYFDLIQKCYRLIYNIPRDRDISNVKSFQRLLNKPKSFTRSQWFSEVLPEIDNYYVCDKHDGERAIVFIEAESDNRSYVKTKKYIITGKLIIDAPELFGKLISNNLILDAEIRDKRLIIFDIMMLDGKNMTLIDFKDRLPVLQKFIKEVNESQTNTTPGGYELSVNNFAQLTRDNYKQILREYGDRAVKLNNAGLDGLIFTPGVSFSERDVNKYRSMDVLKWKPVVTIDFLVLAPPPGMINTIPYTLTPGYKLYLLFCTIGIDKFINFKLSRLPKYYDIMNHNNIHPGDKIFPIHFQSPFAPGDAYVYRTEDKADIAGHICEFEYVPKSKDGPGGFKFVKLRTDKDPGIALATNFGNDFDVVNESYMLMINPITVADLCNEAQNYFSHEKNMKFHALTRFNLFAKSQILFTIKNAKLIIELACGRGADMASYLKYNVRNIVFVDADREALEELTLRYNSRRPPRGGNIELKAFNSMKVMQLDLNTSFENFRLLFPEHKAQADAVVINFALHYLIRDEQSAINFVSKIDYLLMPNGIFIATFFDATKILELPWKSDEILIGGDSEFRLKLPGGINAAKAAQFGAELDVALPFSGGKLYREYLIRPEKLKQVFENSGFETLKSGNFSDYFAIYDKVARDNPDPVKMPDMNPATREYARLYYYVIMQKLAVPETNVKKTGGRIARRT